MNIVFASDTYWPRINGVAVSIEVFRRELTALGHKVLIFVPDYPEIEDNNSNEATSHEEGVIRLPSKSLFYSAEDRLIDVNKSRKIVKRILSEFKPDILHAQSEFSALEIFLEYRRKRLIPFFKPSLPLVMSSHTHWEQYIHIYMPYIPLPVARRIAILILHVRFGKCDMIVSPSSNMRQVLKSYHIRKPVTVIPTGISSEDFNPQGRPSDEPKDPPVLMFVGRHSHEKNPGFLLKILDDVKKQFPNVILRMVGDGPGRRDLEWRAKKMGLTDNIEFMGYQPRTALPDLYRSADVFTFPSKSETQGLVTIEAMLCGTPVVAIGEMGTREVMNGDNGGFMVPDNREIFSARVIELLKDKELWKQKSREAVVFGQRWSSPVLAKELAGVYQRLLKR
ncbi:MAG: glycosyltransferase family 4 protein [Spirochaetaceae bacterium]|nr:MAG: glycosyltransferase family 4 protein [Spirochaetaceae bacterium]